MTGKEIVYYLRYGLECFVLGRKKPIVAGIAVTDNCNLKCRHCVVANQGRGDYSYAKITGWMKTFYERGARILYLQGGEPLLWRSEGKQLDDLVNAARKMGYFKVAVATNGTNPIETSADLIWVSVDGLPERHNQIRGVGVFEKVMENTARARHWNINANMTVNRVNFRDVPEVIRLIASNWHFQGISINFHTPYPGVENLWLPLPERAAVLDQVISLKKEGYPVLNSEPGLKALAKGNYRRPLPMIQMVEKDQIFECCFGRDPGTCAKCGYGVVAELAQLSRLRPKTLVSAAGLFTQGGGSL